MRASEEAEPFGTDHARVEGIAEDLLYLGEAERIAIQTAQTCGDTLRGQIAQRIGARRVELEEVTHEWAAHGIDRLRFACTAVQVADRRMARQDALLQAAVDALQCFLAQIPDVIDGDRDLDI